LAQATVSHRFELVLSDLPSLPPVVQEAAHWVHLPEIALAPAAPAPPWEVWR
jgi:hypothetical protein